MSARKSTSTLHIRIRPPVLPSLFPDPTVKSLPMTTFSPEDQEWIFELAGHTEVFAPLDLEGHPLYPTDEQQASPEGWLNYFEMVFSMEEARQMDSEVPPPLSPEDLHQQLLHYENLPDDLLLEDSDGFNLLEYQQTPELHQRAQQLEERIAQLVATELDRVQQKHLQWIHLHGSHELRGMVAGRPEGTFMVCTGLEWPWSPYRMEKHSQSVDEDPFRLYVLERLHLEHPGAVFVPFLEPEADSRASKKQLQKAFELGGIPIRLDEYPLARVSEEEIDRLQDLLVQPLPAVAVPWVFGHAVYLLSPLPR